MKKLAPLIHDTENGLDYILVAIGFILCVLPILAGWSVVWLEAIKIRLMGD